jgi:hypothetical protein
VALAIHCGDSPENFWRFDHIVPLESRQIHKGSPLKRMRYALASVINVQ